MPVVPPFYTRVPSPRYGPFSLDYYHERSECEIGRKIIEDRNEVLGKGGRQLCSECRKNGAI